MRDQEIIGLYEAYASIYAQEEVEQLDEAEGSYGQTPKATAAYGKLAIKRRETPASEYSERGEKTKKVKSAEKNFYRTLNPDAGNRGKKSTKSIHPAGRKGMTQKDRDWSRGADEYGHSGYDGEGGGGSLPKGKKLERQKKTGVSAESFDLFDYILEHLVAEGYADTNEAALAIMANMSEEWRQSIVEGGTGAFVPSKVDDSNNRRDMLKNRYGQDVSPRIPGPSGGGQFEKPSSNPAGVLRLAKTSSKSDTKTA
jgi:hypothetical protein